MDTCGTLGEPNGCNQFASPDDEDKVAAVFEKNLFFALNVVKSLPNLGRPRNFDNDPSQYQVKATQDIQVNRFDVSYGAAQPVEAIVRKELGPADITVTRPSTCNGNVTIRMAPAPAGERYGEALGQYFERRRATIPATIGTRALRAGDIVNVVVKAGGLQQEFRYRIEATPPGRDQEARAGRSRPRTTPASRRTSTPGYDTRAALPAAARRRADGGRLRGRRCSTSTPRRPTAARRTRWRSRRSSTRRASACSRTSTRSTTTPATTSRRRTCRSPARCRIDLGDGADRHDSRWRRGRIT